MVEQLPAQTGRFKITLVEKIVMRSLAEITLPHDGEEERVEECPHWQEIMET